MTSSDLSLFSYEIMGLVGQDGAGPHDLLQMARRGRILDWAGESQYYSEPKRLARLGYLEARQEPGRTRPRTVYSLTDKGLQALRDWAATPVTLTPVKSEPLLRLLVADLVGEEVTRDGLATLRADLADLRQRLDESASAAEALPHRRKYLLLVNDFLRRLVDLHEDLVDEAERELAPEPEEQAGG
jgi:DNA-binding PadR family transcriptional regulator